MTELTKEFLNKIIDFTKFDKFYNRHISTCDNYSEYTIKLRTSGIGIHVMITCKVCGEKQDVSNYDSW